MRNKPDDEFDSDEDLENARLVEKVSQVIRADPKNMASNLEKLGFAWVDDGYGFDAFYALEPLFPSDSEKGKVLQRIRQEKASEMEDIEF